MNTISNQKNPSYSEIEEILNKKINETKKDLLSFLSSGSSNQLILEKFAIARTLADTGEISEHIRDLHHSWVIKPNLEIRVKNTLELAIHCIADAESKLDKNKYEEAITAHRDATRYIGYLEGLHDSIVANRTKKASLGGKAKASNQKELLKLIETRILEYSEKKKIPNAQMAKEITDAIYDSEHEKRLVEEKTKPDLTGFILNLIVQGDY